MKREFILLIIITFSSCGRINQKNSVNTEILTLIPFELTVTDWDYSMAYGLQYILTEKDLKIIFKGDLEGEKDTVLFLTEVQSFEPLRQLMDLNLDSLKESYENPCIADGSQITVYLKKENRTKTVHLSNFYHKDIGPAIDLINSMIPEHYKIWYDKAELLKRLRRCE